MAVVHFTGQQCPPLEIIRAALRAAAHAPSDRDALDVAGEALRQLAELVRVEVRHGS
ncbi:hypothetical protein [Burkholderia sp. WAC0059]|uniref:hypothetical protein n=1 Tax=Burkholderia sp. WAC0059 TaxID=2066022 RepID=UPI0015E10301|nr:hypothetical protein [Burkholderia sp. WAC0059]